MEGAARVDGSAMRDALISAAKKLGAKVIYGNATFSDGDLLVDGHQWSRCNRVNCRCMGQ